MIIVINPSFNACTGLAKARLIIISELRFALQLDEEEAIKKLDRALPKVEEPVEA